MLPGSMKSCPGAPCFSPTACCLQAQCHFSEPLKYYLNVFLTLKGYCAAECSGAHTWEAEARGLHGLSSVERFLSQEYGREGGQ